jgi:hypothetical protein
MKIFELQHEDGEKEWIAASTVIIALYHYFNTTSTDFIDLHDEADIVEVPESKWDEMKVVNTDYDEKDPKDWKDQTFREAIKGLTGPDILCGTMYE